MPPFEIQKYPTKLTRRLLESSPGSTVEFTLDELLQKAKYEQRWPATGHYIHTGILAVYQMAAQQEPPSEAANIAFRAVQYREHKSGFECTKCQKIDGLCLRVDPANYPSLPIGCSVCIKAGETCDLPTRAFGVVENSETESEPDSDIGSEDAYDEEDSITGEVPDLLQLDNIDNLDDFFGQNTMALGDSRDWGGATVVDDYEHLFRIMTACHDLGYTQCDKYGSVDRELKAKWLKELFAYFPGTIKEVPWVDTQEKEGWEEEGPIPEISTWSIVIPDSIPAAPFPLEQNNGTQIKLPYTFPPPPAPKPAPEPKVTAPKVKVETKTDLKRKAESQEQPGTSKKARAKARKRAAAQVKAE